MGDTAAGNTYHFHRGVGALWAGVAAGAIKNGTTLLDGVSINGQSTALPGNTWCRLMLEASDAVTAGRLSGDRYVTGRNWLGDFAEVIIFDAKLDDADQQGIADYLYNKWFVDSSMTFVKWSSFENLSGAAATGDADGDGVQNFAEYAMGLNPNRADGPALPLAVDGSGNATVTVRNLRDGLTYQVQTSTNLLNAAGWTTQETLSGQTGGTATNIVYSSNLSSSDGKLFIRLKVSE